MESERPPSAPKVDAIDRHAATRTSDEAPLEPGATESLAPGFAGEPPAAIQSPGVDGATAESPARTGGRLLHFDIGARLGAGGMGVVYRAFDTRLRRHVALKVLSEPRARDEQAAARLFREARSAAGIAHSGIAAVYEVHDEHAPPFFVMELVEGITLRDRLRTGRLGVEEAVRLAIELGTALGHAHARGIVHRDVKPENIMLTDRNAVKLLDFGIAKALVDPEQGVAGSDGIARTAEGHVLGTPEYMAPEQALGQELDSRVDVFALGIVLYEALAGVNPFRRASTLETAIAIAREAVMPIRQMRPETPRWVSTCLERCLAKPKSERFEDGAAVAACLALRGVGRRGLGPLATSLLVAVAIVALVAWRRAHSSNPSDAVPERAASPSWVGGGGFETAAYAAHALSMDGKLVARFTDHATIIVRDIDERTERELPSPSRHADASLAFFPDGHTLLVTDPADNRTTLWHVDARTGAARAAGTALRVLERVSPAPDGSRLAAISGSDAYTLAPDGTQLARLPGNPEGGVITCARWSPNSRFLLTYAELKDEVMEISILSADGTIRRSVAKDFRLGVNGDHTSAFWISDSSVGYLQATVRPISERKQTLVEATISSDGPIVERGVAAWPGVNTKIFDGFGRHVLITHDDTEEGLAIGTLSASSATLKQYKASNIQVQRGVQGLLSDGRVALNQCVPGECNMVAWKPDEPPRPLWSQHPARHGFPLLIDGRIYYWRTGDAACDLIERTIDGMETRLAIAGEGAAPECESRLVCAEDHRQTCIAVTEHGDTTNAEWFDRGRGTVGAHLYSAPRGRNQWALSRDGTLLAVPSDHGIVFVDTSTKTATDVKVGEPEPQFIAFIPQSTDLLVTGHRTGGTGIWRINRHGESVALWTSDHVWPDCPVLWPDGKSFVLRTLTYRPHAEVVSALE